jgi:hypothetical protein
MPSVIGWPLHAGAGTMDFMAPVSLSFYVGWRSQRTKMLH